MEEFDMRPGIEAFPETTNAEYVSVADEVFGHVVDDHNSGERFDAADQESGQQKNFRALREEISKMKEEREYWKGQAEAYSKTNDRQYEAPQASREDAYTALDWDDSRDVQKAFDAIRQENTRLREEMRDAFTALETKAQRQDWNSMVTQHVPELTNKNPIFAEMIKNASNPYEAAYLLAELNARSKQPAQTPTPSYENGQRALKNASKPASIASVGGSGQLSAVDYYASMSDEDFMKMASKNLAGI